MTLKEISQRNARRYPNKTAVVFENNRFTFKEFNDRVNSLTNALLGLGVSKGDRIAILADNCPQYVELTMVAAKGGVVISPLNPMLSARETTYLVNNAGASTIIIAENYMNSINSIRQELKTVRNIIVIGNPQDDMKSYEALISKSSPEEPNIQINDDDLLFLPCSGGTTGLPKQIMHTHKSCFFVMLNMLWAFETIHEDVCLVPVPIFWGATIPYLLLPHLYKGCTIVVIKDTSPGSILKIVDEEKITTACFGSNFLPQLVDSPDVDKYNHSSLRRVAVTGAPLPTEVWKQAIKLFGSIFVQTYGLSEVAPITCLPPQDFVLEGSPERMRKIHSCGREAVDMEVRVVDEQGNSIIPGEMGEVIVKSPAVMKGYWNAPKASQEAIKGGYLYTGDMATIDEDGYVYLAGRKKDVITSQGKLISPSEIEDIIYRHPAVLEVAVIGVPGKEGGEAIKAVIVFKKGMKVTAKEIIDFCHSYLPTHAVPQSVDFVASLPKSTVGKVLKYALRDKYTKG
jgi:acyl-CoA synthetase (AMP-forming)/AMP-acid ligase II